MDKFLKVVPPVYCGRWQDQCLSVYLTSIMIELVLFRKWCSLVCPASIPGTAEVLPRLSHYLLLPAAMRSMVVLRHVHTLAKILPPAAYTAGCIAMPGMHLVPAASLVCLSVWFSSSSLHVVRPVTASPDQESVQCFAFSHHSVAQYDAGNRQAL